MRRFSVTVDGQEYTVSVEEISKEAGVPALKKEEPHPAAAAVPPAVTKPTPASPLPASSDPPGGAAVRSPMPGSIIDVPVKVGDTVAKGDILVILEAMKMENEVAAPVAGTVIQVAVKKGDTVNSNDPLVMIV